MKVELSFYKGYLADGAFVLDLKGGDRDGERTVLVGQVTGSLNFVFSYEMSQSDIKRSINAFRGALKHIQKQNSKVKKGAKNEVLKNRHRTI